MKKLALFATTILVASSAFAEDMDVKFQGRFDFQGGARKQSGLAEEQKKVSTNRKNIGLDSKAFFGVRAEAENEMMKYGAQLSLFTNTRQTGSPAYERSHVFMESDMGKLELGANFDAGAKMRITAFTIARATGDDSSNYAIMDVPHNNADVGVTAPIFPSYFIDNLDQTNGDGSRKITYYTPKFSGIQFGVSYVPDTGNLGRGSLKDASDRYNTATTYTVGALSYAEKKPIKDAISLGATFDHEFTENTSMKLAVTGEYGTPANKGVKTDTTVPAPAAPVVTNYKLAKLKTYNVGAIFTSGNYSLVGSYSDMSKSMTSAEVYGKDRKTRYYTAGAVYTQGPVGVSLTYSKANQYKNTMDMYVLGTDYKLAPGLMPYAEVAIFKGKSGLPAVYNSAAPKTKFKGAVFILGLQASF